MLFNIELIVLCFVEYECFSLIFCLNVGINEIKIEFVNKIYINNFCVLF